MPWRCQLQLFHVLPPDFVLRRLDGIRPETSDAFLYSLLWSCLYICLTTLTTTTVELSQGI